MFLIWFFISIKILIERDPTRLLSRQFLPQTNWMESPGQQVWRGFVRAAPKKCTRHFHILWGIWISFQKSETMIRWEVTLLWVNPCLKKKKTKTKSTWQSKNSQYIRTKIAKIRPPFSLVRNRTQLASSA